MNAPKKTLVFLLIACVQLAVPAWMIVTRERTLSGGHAYRFPVAPVDPYDAFRGRYVAIRLDGLDLPAPTGTVMASGQRVYARIAQRPDGTAYFESLSASRPAEGDYLDVRVRDGGEQVHLLSPFDRFYLDEELAPAAEAAYREHASRTNNTTYAVIRVREGRGVIEDLVIADLPIRQAAIQRTRGP